MFKCIAKVIVFVILFTSLSNPILVRAEDVIIDMNNGDLMINESTYEQTDGTNGTYQQEDTLNIINHATAVSGVTVDNNTVVDMTVDYFLSYLSIGDNSTVNLSSSSPNITIFNWNVPAISIGLNSILNIIGSSVKATSIFGSTSEIEGVSIDGKEGSTINLVEKDGVASDLTYKINFGPTTVNTSENIIKNVTVNGTSSPTESGLEAVFNEENIMNYVREYYVSNPAESIPSEPIPSEPIPSAPIPSEHIPPELEPTFIPISESNLTKTTNRLLDLKSDSDFGTGIRSENYKDSVLTSWSEVDTALENIEVSDLTDEAICSENDACLLRMNIQNSSGVVPEVIWNKINETPDRAVHFHLGEGVAITACTDTLNDNYSNLDLSKTIVHKTEGNINYRTVKFNEKRNLDGTLQFHTYLPDSSRGQEVSVYQVDESGGRTLLTTTTVGDNSSVCMEIEELQDYEFEYISMEI